MMSSSVANPLKLWFECMGLKNKITFNGHSLLCRIKHELVTSVCARGVPQTFVTVPYFKQLW